MKKYAKKLKLKAVHLRIPYKEYEFLSEESAKRGISMARYVANLLQREKSHRGVERAARPLSLEESEIAPPKEASKPFLLEFTELTDEELEKKLQGLEIKYQLDSETFYQLYQQGKASEGIEDRILWAGLYRLKRDEKDIDVEAI